MTWVPSTYLTDSVSSTIDTFSSDWQRCSEMKKLNNVGQKSELFGTENFKFLVSVSVSVSVSKYRALLKDVSKKVYNDSNRENSTIFKNINLSQKKAK